MSTIALAEISFTFQNTKNLYDRKAYWQTELLKLPQKELFNIIIGISPPPRPVLIEAEQQVNLLIDTIVTQLESEKKTIPPHKIISGKRDFHRQRLIWNRKYKFKNKFVFGLMTESAKAACKELIAGNEYGWNSKNKKHALCWYNRLTPDQRQFEILQTSSAPGTSRHHWGTDFDLFDQRLSPTNWKIGGNYGQIYTLLVKNAKHYGFFQPYGRLDSRGGKGYLEERWHWSYYPISDTLLDVIKKNPIAFEAHLFKHWGNHEHYSYIKKNWKDYVFGITPMIAF